MIRGEAMSKFKFTAFIAIAVAAIALGFIARGQEDLCLSLHKKPVLSLEQMKAIREKNMGRRK